MDYEAIIIGARIAGSVVGILLGSKGYRILVLDQASFPSDTLSTHFFRWPTFAALNRIGMLDAVSSVAPRLPANFNSVDGHVFSEPVTTPEGPGHHLCVRRVVMDPWSGQGIDQASTHATYLADALLEFLSKRASWDESMHSYWKRRNEFSTATYERTCKAARDLRPMTQAALKRRGLV